MKLTKLLFLVGTALAVVPARAQLRPDLETTRCAVTPSSAAPGATVTVTYDVQNVGQWPTAERWQDKIWFNNRRSLSGATQLWSTCKYFPVLVLVGQTYSQFRANPPVLVSLPSGLAGGTYYIGYECNVNYGFGDPCGLPWQFAESRSSNNVEWATIRVPSLPDFVVTDVSANPTRWLGGEFVTGTVTVANQGGNRNLGSVRVDLFASPSPSPSGPVIASTQPVLLQPGASQTLSVSFTAPTLPGGCYDLVAFVDPNRAVAESNESNNTLASAVVSGPSPQVTPFGNGCAGTAGVPTLTTARVPDIGNPDFDVTAGNLPSNPLTVAALLIGGSNTFWAGTPLPFDLGVAGMPGCSLLVSPDAQVATLTGGQPTVDFPLPIPNAPNLIGASLFLQAVVSDVPANPAGLVVSAGLDALIGKM